MEGWPWPSYFLSLALYWFFSIEWFCSASLVSCWPQICNNTKSLLLTSSHIIWHIRLGSFEPPSHRLPGLAGAADRGCPELDSFTFNSVCHSPLVGEPSTSPVVRVSERGQTWSSSLPSWNCLLLTYRPKWRPLRVSVEGHQDRVSCAHRDMAKSQHF